MYSYTLTHFLLMVKMSQGYSRHHPRICVSTTVEENFAAALSALCSDLIQRISLTAMWLCTHLRKAGNPFGFMMRLGETQSAVLYAVTMCACPQGHMESSQGLVMTSEHCCLCFTRAGVLVRRIGCMYFALDLTCVGASIRQTSHTI